MSSWPGTRTDSVAPNAPTSVRHWSRVACSASSSTLIARNGAVVEVGGTVVSASAVVSDGVVVGVGTVVFGGVVVTGGAGTLVAVLPGGAVSASSSLQPAAMSATPTSNTAGVVPRRLGAGRLSFPDLLPVAVNMCPSRGDLDADWCRTDFGHRDGVRMTSIPRLAGSQLSSWSWVIWNQNPASAPSLVAKVTW